MEGPLNIDRSPQGQPLIFQAGSSEPGKNLAAKAADAIFTNATSREEAEAFYKDVKQRAFGQGRNADELLIFPGLRPIIGKTKADAEAKYEAIADLVSTTDTLNYLGRYFDHFDFSQFSLDAPFPDIGDVGKNSFRSTTDSIKQKAKQENLTLREVARLVTTPKGPFLGTAQEIADELIDWYEAEAADGFILAPPVLGEGLDDFIEGVVPLLREAGVFRDEYEGETLRDQLGLPVKENRHSKAVHR